MPASGEFVQPGHLADVGYSQGLLAVTSEHRISLRLGIVDVLPGVDFDMMAGGMFEDTVQLGEFTSTSSESYWFGLVRRGDLVWVHADQLQHQTVGVRTDSWVRNYGCVRADSNVRVAKASLMLDTASKCVRWIFPVSS